MKRFWSILCLALAISLCFGAVALATEAENEHTHVYANAYDSDKTKEPTCEEKGYAHRLCTICGEEDKDQPYIVVDPLGHYYDPSIVPDQFVEVLEKATCTENGMAKCARMCANGCGTVIEYYNTSDPDAVDAMEGSTSIRALGHDWGEEEEVEGTRKDPTCVENGSYEVHIVCQRCGVEKPDSRRTVNDIKEDEEIEATGHEEADPVQENVKEATCMTPEEYDEVVYCSKCHIELSRKHVVGMSNPDNHKPGTPVQENFVDSTCVDKGSYDMVVYCTLCKSELSRTPYEITILKPHTWVEDLDNPNNVEPTCYSTGLVHEYCKVCGAKNQPKELPRKEHTYGPVIDVPATCMTTGGKLQECTVKGCTADVEGHFKYIEVYPIDPNNHKWILADEDLEAVPGDPDSVTRMPTCTQHGVYAYYCEYNNTHRKAEQIAPLGHDVVKLDAIAPTCTEVGYTEGEVCVREGCDGKAKKLPAGYPTEQLDEITAEYGQYLVTKAPKEIPANGHTKLDILEQYTYCTAQQADADDNNPNKGNGEGYIKYKCAVCGEEVEEGVKPTGHDWVRMESDDMSATCITGGYASFRCTKCGEEKQELIPATGEHQWGEEIYIAPTCKTAGRLDRICEVCGFVDHLEFYPIDENAHNFEIDWNNITKYPSCTEEGFGAYVCTECGFVKYAAIPVNDHEWDEGTVTKAATCTEEGEMTYTCIWCETTKTEPIEKIPHTEEVIPGKPATADEPGLTDGIKCSVCGEILKEQEEISPLCKDGHILMAPVVTKEATCTEAGEKTYKCFVCGNVVETEAIPATGHAWDEGTVTTEATCTAEGVKIFKCTKCDAEKTEVIAKLAHTEEVIPGVEPTETETGLTEGIKCSVCGEILKAQEVIPAKGIAKNGLVLDDDGEWRYYVDGEFAKDVTGIVEFEGGSFFVADGVLCKDANGLQMYPEGTWYFLANGQVQKQYSGLALYDGEWFYIVNGRLDKSLYGLVEFQGGQFLVNEGMILSSANGLWMDKDGTWYYLEKGQVAFWFNGAVQYQGGTFRVVNGIVK